MPAKAATATAVHALTPQMLPIDIADFTGRRDELSRLCDALTGSRDGSARIVSICGGGGIGKTALAIHCAHRLADTFNEGQLYVNLNGSSARPLRPVDVLERLIRELGGPDIAVPTSVEEQVGLYRSLLAGKRILIVLDDADGEDQVQLLLPGSAGCTGIVTGRRPLTGLAGVQSLELSELDQAEAVELLERIIGRARITHEWRAATQIVDLCDGLPLAIRISGARLAARPHWSLRQFADRVADEERRLDMLTHGPFSVRRCWEHGYHRLDPRARQLLNRMARLDTPDFGAWLSLPLMGTADSDVLDLLDRIVDARLLVAAGRDGVGQARYRFPPLIRLYVREWADKSEPVEEIRLALGRSFEGWLHMARRAERRLSTGGASLPTNPEWMLRNPSLADPPAESPLRWFKSEQGAIGAAIRQAHAWHMRDISCALTEVASALESRVGIAGNNLDALPQARDVSLDARPVPQLPWPLRCPSVVCRSVFRDRRPGPVPQRFTA